MERKIDFNELFYSTRARVYLLWAALVGVGFVATQYYQKPGINGVWFVLALIGFIYMYRVMPLGVKQMKAIYASWLIPIAIGLAISAIAVRSNLVPSLVAYLGPVWLVVMATGYFWNGLVDVRGLWYYVAAIINGAAAAAIYFSDSLLIVQYLLAAIVSVWSMLLLWTFYSDL